LAGVLLFPLFMINDIVQLFAINWSLWSLWDAHCNKDFWGLAQLKPRYIIIKIESAICNQNIFQYLQFVKNYQLIEHADAYYIALSPCCWTSRPARSAAPRPCTRTPSPWCSPCTRTPSCRTCCAAIPVLFNIVAKIIGEKWRFWLKWLLFMQKKRILTLVF
jgi:hypothetical protein